MFDTEKPVFFYVGVLHKLACSGEVAAAARGGGEVTLVPLGTLRAPGGLRALGPPTHLLLGEGPPITVASRKRGERRAGLLRPACCF